MAGFICDLCGGHITMQANKTGVCKECGMEYDLEAIRAKMDAASKPVSAPAPAASVAVQSLDEVDREALITYLNDVRVMETIVVETNKKLAHLNVVDQNKRRSVSSLYVDTNQLPEEPTKPEDIVNVEEFKTITKVGIGSIIIGLICLFVEWITFGTLLIVLGIVIIVAVVLVKNKKTKEYKEKYALYESKMKVYEEKLKDYESMKLDKVSKANENYNIFDEKKNKACGMLNKDLFAVKKILQKAYSANIIPVQFRNIQGVYYLYDYLSTSNQTLSEALMQCNLEAIKQKLDKMIQLQSEQIVQQAVTNAKLGKIYEVTEATMNNTAVAAKYAQIAAINSEVTKKLASSSLAYQKADFWLK